MDSASPLRTLLLLAMLATGTLMLTLALPEESALPGGMTLKAPKLDGLNRLFVADTDAAKREELQALIREQPAIEELAPPPAPSIDEEPDYVAPKPAADPAKLAPLADRKADALIQPADIRQPIELPAARPAALDSFFRALAEQRADSPVLRVFHLGDSQLEGDRITESIRYYFQRRFGGAGAGLLPLAVHQEHNASFLVNFSGLWTRHPLPLPERSLGFPPGSGATGGYVRFGKRQYFTPVRQTDSLLVNHYQTASLSLAKPKYGRLVYREAERLRVLAHNPHTPLDLTLTQDGDTLSIAQLPLSERPVLHRSSVWLDSGWQAVEARFGSAGDPRLYALALDGAHGLAVDNLPFRGGSGVEFSSRDTLLMKRHFAQMNVKLIVLQYGVNVVPAVVGSKEQAQRAVRNYRIRLLRELSLLRRLAPSASVLVVGVSDMAIERDGRFQSYRYVDEVRDAQRAAAHATGCAFWDAFEAMGGPNAMPLWVKADPPLARADHVHFTRKGGRLIGKLIYDALMFEYQERKKAWRANQGT